MRLQRRELARDLAKELDIPSHEADQLLTSVILVMGRRLVQGHSVGLTNFGTLSPMRRALRSFGAHTRNASAQPDIVQVRFKAADRLLEALREGDDQVSFRKAPNRLPSAS